MKKSKLINLTKALSLRLVVIIHSIFLYIFVVSEIQMWFLKVFMFLGALLIVLEGLYNSLKRHGQEWKWGSPLLFIYISFIYLPSLITYDIRSFKLVDSDKNSSLNSNSSLHKKTQSQECAQVAILDVFFLIVILCRWCMPKGKITLDDLSKLLLLYITIVADILDMMKMLRDLNEDRCIIESKDQMFIMSLVFISISIFHLCMGYTATRNKIQTMVTIRSPTRKRPIIIIGDNYDTSTILRIKCSQLLEILSNFKAIISKLGTRFVEREIWSILLLVIFKELPFAIIRTLFWVTVLKQPSHCAFHNISVFFTLKNYLVIAIQINRCYVLFKSSDDMNISKQCVLTSYVKKSSDIQLTEKRIPMLGTFEYGSPSSSVESGSCLLKGQTLFDHCKKTQNNHLKDSWKISSTFNTRVEDTELSSISLEVQNKNKHCLPEYNYAAQNHYFLYSE